MLQRVTEYVPVPVVPPEAVREVNGARPEGLTLAGIMRILRRRAGVILATTLAVIALTLLVIVFAPALYTGTATVLIDPRRPNVINLDTTQTTIQSPATDDSAIESQVLLAQSVAVLRRVVDNLKLTQNPDFTPQPGLLDPVFRLFATPHQGAPDDAATLNSIAVLQKRLKVTRQRNSFLVDINVSAHDPRLAAEVANAVANAYFMELIRSKADATKTAAGWLNQQLDELKSRVIASDKAVEEFRAAHKLNLLQQGATSNDQQISDLNTKLIEARAEAAEAKAKYDQVAQIARTKADPGSVGEALSSDTIARLRAQYADLVKNEADMSSKYGAQHPAVAGVRAQLRDTQRLINDEVQRILQARQHSYDVASARVTSLEKSLDQLQGISGESGQDQVRVRELQREADANRSLYETFLGRYKEATARESLSLPEARIVTSANVPLRPSFPRPLLFLALSLPLGIAFGSLLAVGIDRFDHRVKTLDNVEAMSGVQAISAMPLVGLRELSRIAKRGRRALSHYKPNSTRMLPLQLQPPLMRYIAEEPNSLFAEGVRAVRLAVQRAARIRRTQTVMVTSAIDGEGKTTLAANLALSYAMMGIRTLLVEGDLRNPEMTRSLCPGTDLGLFDVALGRATLQQAILVEPTTKLSVLPAPVSNELETMSELVFSDGMGIILNELRRHYEIIVIDAPPLVPFVDSRALGEHADAIVLTAGWNRTPEDVVVRALNLLSPLRDRILGTVMTRVDLQRMRHYDYYQSSAYIKPYYGEARQT